MIPSESNAPDSPFPGAHSQVPGVRGAAGESTMGRSTGPLQLEASVVPWERGWLVRLPVRAEHIQIDKQVVVYERAEVRRHQTEATERVGASIRREQVRVEVEGDADVAQTPGRDDDRHR